VRFAHAQLSLSVPSDEPKKATLPGGRGSERIALAHDLAAILRGAALSSIRLEPAKELYP